MPENHSAAGGGGGEKRLEWWVKMQMGRPIRTFFANPGEGSEWLGLGWYSADGIFPLEVVKF